MKVNNVLIVDDHAVMRKGLNVLLNDFYPSMNIYEAGDGDELLNEFKQHTIDLLVIDIHIPQTDTIGLVEIVSIKYPETYILVFSMMPERIYGRRLRKAGAKAFLPKEATIEQIKIAFDAIIENRHLSPDNALWIASKTVEKPQNESPFSLLSFREFEILNYLLEGKSIHVIAKLLNLKPSTIGTYKSRSFEKLKISNIFELKDLAVLYNLQGLIRGRRIPGE